MCFCVLVLLCARAAVGACCVWAAACRSLLLLVVACAVHVRAVRACVRDRRLVLVAYSASESVRACQVLAVPNNTPLACFCFSYGRAFLPCWPVGGPELPARNYQGGPSER